MIVVARILAAISLVASMTVSLDAPAHDKLGANLNFIGDFQRNHEFNDLVKQSRRFLKTTAFDDGPLANRASIGADGWPTEDFRLFPMTAQQGVASVGGTYKLIFTGQATIVANSATIQNKVHDAGTNTTRADVVFVAGNEGFFLDFTSTGGSVKDIRLLRPGVPEANTPLLTTTWRTYTSRFNVLRFLDWTRTNGNRAVSWSDRTTPDKNRTEAYIAQWETVVAAANSLNRDAWINVPVQANDEFVTNLATLFRDGLNPNLNLYVEYGNELWNFSIRDVDMDHHNGDTPFNAATINRDLAAASPVDSPLRFEAADNTTLGYRRVALRLKQISDIFRTVWGNSAMMTRVRPVLAGQMSNSFVVSEGLRLVDEGLGVKPDTVFYAIAGAPYVFASAIPDADADETPGMTVTQILDGMEAGANNAPNETNAYQYLSHAGMGAWYGLKVMAYEAGFDNFGNQNIANKRLANLDPRIKTICKSYVNQWHAFGFDTLLWFNAGAASYDTQFGMWPLVESLDNQATPKNQCMDELLAASLPAVTVGTAALGAPIAGGNFRGSANPSGTVTGTAGPFGFPGFVEYLVRADVEGIYNLVWNGTAPATESFRVKLNNTTVAAGIQLPTSPGNSSGLNVALRQGLNALRIERNGSGASWSITSFTFTLVSAGPTLDLALGQSASPSPVGAGKDVIFTLTMANNATSAATNAKIDYGVPAGSTFIWASPGCANVAGLVTCTSASLAAGASKVFRVVVRPTAAGSITANSILSATQSDPLPSDNSRSTVVTVNATAAGTPIQRFRLYSDVTKEHHFTTDLNEYNVLGTLVGTWVQEGPVGKILNNPGSFGGVQAVPYFRLYDNATQWHHWTTDANEYYTLGFVFSGWNLEGVDGYILPTAAAGTTELYRLNYPFLGSLHHWTIDLNEYNTLIASFGWVGEPGAGFVVQ